MRATVSSISSMRGVALFIFTLLLAGIVGSTTAYADQRNVLGAIIGGGTGALLGDSMGGRDGAIIGGALGAVAGVVITQAQYRPHVEYVEYVPPQPYYRAPPVIVPARVYYPRYEREWERRRWEHHHQRDRGWDRDGYRR